MASGISQSGINYFMAGSSLSATAPDSNTNIGMYAHATQYRYPRATSNLSIGTYYLGKTFYYLATLGMQCTTGKTGNVAVSLTYGFGNYGNTYTLTSTSAVTSTPTAPDGYRVFQDTAYSTALSLSYTSALYNGIWQGWYNNVNGAGQSLISSATSVNLAGYTGATIVIGFWS
jgi:hypothetical protein